MKTFDQTHELAMILFQPAYEATRACGADVVLGVVEPHVPIDAEVAAFEDGIANSLEIFV